MRAVSLYVFPLLAVAAGCGTAADQVPTPDPAPVDPIGTSRQYVVWLPVSDPLNVEHFKWHFGYTSPDATTLLPCGSPGVHTGKGQGTAAQCNNFQTSGKEFLRFHRDFLHRLAKRHADLGRPASERRPWNYLDSDLNIYFGSDPPRINAFQNLINDFDPSTGQPFANEEAFGTYLENALHNDLHGITARVYPTDVDTAGNSVPTTIGPVNMSATSTYFFGIHGLVETLYERWQRSKLKDGMYSNLIFRNIDNGTNSVATVSYNTSTNKLSVVSTDPLMTVPIPNSYNWYVGAVADFDFDGNNDIVWHGPANTSGPNISFWKMNGTSYVSNLSTNAPTVDGSWTLIGAQDYNQDLQPDLVWANGSNQVAIWYMNGPSVSGFYSLLTLPSGFRAQLVADFNNGTPALVARNYSTGATTINLIDFSSGKANAYTTITSPTADIYTGPTAVGHFHATANGFTIDKMDIAWTHLADNSTSLWTSNSPNSFSYVDRGTVTGQPAGRIWTVGAH